jgi:predicted ATPase with chaperone activity
MQHLNKLNLGPNLVTMVPHSMLRIEVMGFDASISRDPTEDELVAMEKLLEKAMDRLGLSARGYHRILRVARTLADMRGRKNIGIEEVSEALSYRRLDRWGANS